MKGTLHKTESGWQVWYHAKEDLFYGNTGVIILPLIDSDYYEVNRPGQYYNGKEVEFEIVEFPVPPTNGPVSNSISKYARLVNEAYIPTKGGEGWYKILDKAIEDRATRSLTEDDAWPKYSTRADQLREQGWQQIMKESGSWDDSEILAYIIKNYNPPTKKQDQNVIKN